jgi:hypothetical protein
MKCVEEDPVRGPLVFVAVIGAHSELAGRHARKAGQQLFGHRLGVEQKYTCPL